MEGISQLIRSLSKQLSQERSSEPVPLASLPFLLLLLSYAFFLLTCRFFQVNPEYQKLFPEFRNIRLEDIGKTSGLLGHPKHVTKSLENAVSALKDAEIFTAYMEELGRRHQDRGLKPCHLDVSSVCLKPSCHSDVSSVTHGKVLSFNSLTAKGEFD